ncbi:MAG TPA: aquaporin [Verrucomicrobiae bacterium]|nr:aquaporin [Verrucomicrobiae bacterium]
MKSEPLTLTRWFVAELIGTMFLSAVAGTAMMAHLGLVSGYSPLYVPFAVGAVVLVMFYVIGHISGCHLNPAVSVAMFVMRKITFPQFMTYLVAQFLGAWLGIRLIVGLVGIPPSAPEFVSSSVSLGEFMGAFILVLAIAAVVQGRVKDGLGGIVIGVALAVGLTLAMVTGGGYLNPAIAATLGAQDLAYLLMPILGGLAAAAATTLFDDRKI